jgi:hypothetical protein
MVVKYPPAVGDCQWPVAALEHIRPSGWRAVAAAIAPLSNRKAWAVLQGWMEQHVPHTPGKWPAMSKKVWAERAWIRQQRKLERQRAAGDAMTPLTAAPDLRPSPR